MHQRKSYWIILIILAITFLLTSCGEGDSQESEPSPNVSDPNSNSFLAGDGRIPSQPQTANIAVINTTGDTTTAPQAADQRIIIKSANLTLTVADPAEKVQEITQLAEGSGGWIVSSQITAVNAVLVGQITIRVPAEQFTSTLTAIKNGVLQVDSEEVRGQDVTQEYTDLESALVNLELAEEQIQDFLELAENTDEVLRIHDKLTSVHGQIETTQGRLQYYSESAAYSSIAVTLHQPEPEIVEEKPVVEKDDPWRPGDTFDDAIDSLVVTLQAVADVLIWLVAFFLPIALVLILLGSPLWLGWRYRQRRQSQQASQTPAHE